MLDPFLSLVSRPEANMLRDAEKRAAARERMPAILRAVYSHEVYTVVRRMVKYEKAEDMLPKTYTRSVLCKLLGIDVKSTCVKVRLG